ncbi:MAG: hypothetical protein HDT29_07140 [Clostridiales bacterium]|nr:hypothetical protein [Clostridiales bacterium]
MLKATTELFMSEYFLTKAILGKYLENDENLFYSMSKIFLISESEAKRLYGLTNNDIAKGITTAKDFMQHQRMEKYSALTGSAKNSNAEWEEVARIKGNAILFATASKLVSDADSSRNVVYNALSNAVASGLVFATRIMGVLQCEGIFLGKNEEAGVKKLAKAANWNDCVSTLALLHYCTDNRDYNMARLRQVVADSPFEELYATALDCYNVNGTAEIEGVRLLEKAFSSGVLKKEVYDPQYARILHSAALSIKDKERVIFSGDKAQLSTIGDLPLKLTLDKVSAVDTSEFPSLALRRNDERLKIERAFKNSDLRGLPSYRPICLCCESKYVLNSYARTFANKRENTHVEIIDVAELSEYDLEPSANNIFVRCVDEDKDNRFLLFFKGEISDRRMDAVKGILQSARRSKFHLNAPGVTLDLSAVLPICFCDKENAKLLKPYCDVIQLAETTADEFADVVEDIFASKEKVYGIGKIKLEGEVSEVFDGFDVDTAEKLIDSAVRARREQGANITLSKEILKSYSADYKMPKIGFGGNENGR